MYICSYAEPSCLIHFAVYRAECLQGLLLLLGLNAFFVRLGSAASLSSLHESWEEG